MTTEQQATHSPGPWVFTGTRIRRTEDARALAVLYSQLANVDEDAELRANGHVMAAAPDLLAAAEAALSVLEMGEPRTTQESSNRDTATAALRTATQRAHGEES